MEHADFLFTTTHAKRQALERYNWTAQLLMIKATEAMDIGDKIPDDWIEMFMMRSTPIPPDTLLKLYEGKVYVFSTKEYVMRLVTVFNSKMIK